MKLIRSEKIVPLLLLDEPKLKSENGQKRAMEVERLTEEQLGRKM